MSARRLLLFMLLLVAVFPLTAQAANRTIFILIDPQANRAYVPEGTVLPQGLQIRAEAFKVRKFGLPAASLAERFRPALQEGKRLETPAMVFEYAPAARFEKARKQYEARYGAPSQSRVKANSGNCLELYASGYNSGPHWTYYNDFLTTYCGPEGTTTVGNAYTWEFTAQGGYSDDDEYIYPNAWISDNNNNFNCYHEIIGYGQPSCFASATTVWTNTGCTNTVHTGAQLYVIEYQEGYVPYYVGFSFQIDWCTTFY